MYQKPLILSCNRLEAIDNCIKQKSSEEFFKKLKQLHIVFNNSKQLIQCLVSHLKNGGEGGIRTHGTLARSPVFKTGAFDHSADFTVLL